MMAGVGLCGDSIVQCSAVPGSSPRDDLYRLSEPESPYSMDLSPPAPKQSLSLPISLVGSQDMSLSISP